MAKAFSHDKPTLRFAPAHIPLFKKFSNKNKVTKLKIAQPKFPKLAKI